MEETKLATLIYIIDKKTNTVWMAIKTRKIGVGFPFGYGGKIKPGQTADDCIIEETHDESGGLIDKTFGIKLCKEKLERVALMDFYNSEDRPLGNPSFRVLCYRTFEYEGFPISTEEMQNPQQYPVDNLPFEKMKPGDELFVPRILAGVFTKGWIRFSVEAKQVLDYKISDCDLQELTI